MGYPFYLGIIENAALLIAIAVLYDFVWLKYNKQRIFLLQCFLGIMLGLVGIILMKNPWVLIEGIVFDIRSVLLTISGLFFGAISTLIAMIITALYRISMGGDGVYMGVAVIVSSSIISIFWSKFRPQVLSERRLWEIYIVAIVVHLVMLGCTAFLPSEIRLETLKTIWWPVLLFYPATTVLIAMLLFQREKNWKNKTLLAESEKKYRLLFEQTPIPMWIYDLDTLSFLEVNQAAIEHYGYSREEFLSMTIKDIRPEEDIPKLLERLKSHNGNHQTSGDWRHRKKNGEIIFVQLASHETIYHDRLARHVTINDVTQLIKSHEIISQKEREFREIFNSSFDSILLHDIETGRIIDCNEITTQLYGFTKEEILNGNLGDLSANFPPYTKEKANEYIKKAIEVEPQDFEWLARKKSGEYFWVNVRLKLVEISGIKIVMAIIVDISETKKAQQQYHESEQRFLKVMHYSKDAIGLLDENFRFIECNLSAARLHGYNSREEFLENTLHPSELSPEYQPNGELSSELSIKMIEIALEQGSNKLEWLHKRKNGETFWAEVSLTPIIFNARTMVYAVWRDISEQKKNQEKVLQSEREFREIFNSTLEAILIYDIETGKIVDCNIQTSALYGYSKEELIGQPFGVLSAHNEQYNIDEASKWAERAINVGPQTYSWLAKKKSGETFWVEISLKKSTIGGKVRLMAVVRDISERKQFEQYLIDAKEKAEESDHLKSAFLMNLSHEIRTPLNAILGFSELLKSNILNEKKRDYVEIIHSSGKRLLSIINDTLEIAMIDTKTVIILSEEINLDSFLNKIAEEFAFRAQSKGLIFEFENKTHDLVLMNDGLKIHRILENILNNAVTFTQEGKVTLKCYMQNDNICFEVEDTGVGIDPKDLPMIFKRFYRVQSNISITNGGIGLGLSIAKAYTELLGGTLNIDSKINHGTKVTIKLPLSNDSVDLLQLFKNQTSWKGNQQNILIIDEESDYRQYLQNTLTKANYNVRAVAGMNEAISLISQQNKFELVIFRVKNVLKGIEQHRELKSFLPNIPIVALTTNLLLVDLKKLFKEGFDDVISSLISSFALYKIIKENLK
ncbi:MAG TPA: PAS domain S-box protein [Salinivirgaceae bacterium]|nr:PAS domain S-box protein [Salinivirgaceae bacterium]